MRTSVPKGDGSPRQTGAFSSSFALCQVRETQDEPPARKAASERCPRPRLSEGWARGPVSSCS